MQLVAHLSNWCRWELGFSIPRCSGFERLVEEISEELTASTTKLITGVRVKFQFERLQNKLRSSMFNNCKNHCLELWDLQCFKRQWTTCLYIRNGKLDTKWRGKKTKSWKENSRTALDGKFIT